MDDSERFRKINDINIGKLLESGQRLPIFTYYGDVCFIDKEGAIKIMDHLKKVFDIT